MSDATFTFRVEQDLKTSFASLAKDRDLSAAQLLRAMMRDAVARQRDDASHDRWFRSEVEQAVQEADDPTIARIPHTTVEADWDRQRETLSRRADA